MSIENYLKYEEGKYFVSVLGNEWEEISYEEYVECLEGGYNIQRYHTRVLVKEVR